MSRSTLEKELPPALLNAENLPSLPAVAVEVLRLTEDEDCTIDDLAAVLCRDPALSAKLLKLANSSHFSPGTAVTTLQRAALVLGLKTVKLMSLSFSLVGALPRVHDGTGFELREFWKRSIVNAVTARVLGERMDPSLGDEAFLCGLLGHMGRLVLAQAFGEPYEGVLREHGGWPSPAAEHQMLGFDSRDVVQALFRTWRIPSEILLPLYHRHAPDRLPADVPEPTRRLTRTLAMALLAEEVLCGTDPHAPLARLGALAGPALGLGERALDELLVRLEIQVAETAALLNVDLPDVSYQDIVDRARLRIVDVGIGLDVELRHATKRSAELKDDLRRARRRSEELEGNNRELRTAASTDALTGLANRKSLDEFLVRQVRDRIDGSVPRGLGVLMIDLDRFKSLNDSYGHQAGDEILRMVGSLLSRATRRGDFCARYGGEEFTVILPQTTPFSLRAAAERLRQEIAKLALPFEGQELRVTASFGGVCSAELEREDDGQRMLKLADHYLYKAKESGRNRSEIPQRIVKLPRR